MQTNTRIAIGTLIAAVTCVFVTAALWIIALTLSGAPAAGTPAAGAPARAYDSVIASSSA